MATAYTSLLGLALPVTGELSGTWGDTVNNSITSLLDSAISGTTTISADADITLTTTTGAANEAREAILLWTAGGTVTRNITAPAQSKTYIVINKSSSTQSIVLRGVGPTTGVTIVQGESAVCAWNGTDFIKVSNISGAGSFTNLSYTGTLTGGTGIVNLGSGQFYKDASGNVGIGTSSPADKLHVAFSSGSLGGIRVQNTNSGGQAALSYYNDVGTQKADIWWNNSGSILNFRTISTDPMVFSTNNAERMRIDTSGNVGIGNTAANVNDQVGAVRPLLVSKSDSSTTIAGSQAAIVIGNSDTTTSNTSQLSFAAITGASATYFTSAAINCIFGARTNAQYPTGQLTFSTSTTLNSAPTEKMRIDSSGNVGIGTSSPAYKLEVRSTMAVLDGSANIGFWANGTSYTQVWQTLQSVNDFIIQTAASKYMSFGTNSTERMRIDSSGNVGIGTSSPIRKLTVSTAGTAEFVLQDTSQAANSRNWRIFNAANTLYFGTLNDAGTAGNDYLTINSSGNVGIGTSSPTQKLDVEGGTRTFGIANFDGATYAAIDLKAAGVHKAYIATANAVIGGGSVNDLAVDASTGNLILATGDVERMRIDSSGNLLVGTTSTGGGKCVIENTSANQLVLSNKDTGSAAQYACYFLRNNSIVGSIQTTNTATTYVTSSDYRLKENIQPMTGALATVAQLKPVTYNWKLDGSVGQGFIAHELAEVCPEAVAGVKDAVDADGNIISQGIDTSFLVATLTAAIQEQQALITSLTARITALEST